MLRRNCRRRKGRSEDGFVLVAGLFLVLLIGGLAVGLLEESQAAKSYLSLHESNLSSLEIAEIGLIRAEMEIRGQVDHGGDGMGNVLGMIAQGAYEVTVHDDPVSADRWMLRARGTLGMSRRMIEVGVRRRVNRHFVEGLFSLEDLVMNGDVQTDSYDSALGTYATQAVNADAYGPYGGTKGHVGSNSDVILLGTSTAIRGNAIPGPLREVRLSGSPLILGDKAPRMDLIDIPPEPYGDFEAAFLVNDNDAVLGSLPGNKARYSAANYTLTIQAQETVTLPSGTYFLKSLVLNGGATLEVNGDVHLYVTDTLDLSGGGFINHGAPTQFQVHAHPYPLPTGFSPSATSVKVNGGSHVAMSLYGPGADLDISGGDHFFGAAVAKSINVSGNVFFHYDAALGRTGIEGVATMERLFWREPRPPRR